MDIKPIETRYKGHLFRSRLEARWAVFFDEMGIEWEYEKEGYTLEPIKIPDIEEIDIELNKKTINYLPDFYLPQLDMFVEIKGDSIKKIEYIKAQRLSFYSKKKVAIIKNLPFDGTGIDFGEWDHKYFGLFLYTRIHENEIYLNMDWPGFFCKCDFCGKLGFEYSGFSSRISCCESNKKFRGDYGFDYDKVINALSKARLERFEHFKNMNKKDDELKKVKLNSGWDLELFGFEK
jgi:hypothetical protein